MLSPKRTLHRKQMKGRMKGVASRGNSARQIEAARIAMTRKIKRGGRVWIRVFPDKPITRHPAEARMGKGKGGVEFWVAVILPGRIIFEMGGVERELAMEALHVASQKLPLKCKIIEESEI